MARKKRNPRMTLRLDKDFYAYLCDVAEDLGIGPNALMNLLLRRAAGPFQVMRRMIQWSTGGKPRTQVTLRIQADLDEVIRKRRADLSLLIGDMLYYALPPFVVERQLYKEYVLTGRYESLLREWRKERPHTTAEEFDGELRRLLAGQPSALAEFEIPRPAPSIPRPAPNRKGMPDLDGP